MKTIRILFVAALAATGLCGLCGAGEEIMPLVPGAFGSFGDSPDSLRRISSVDGGDGGGTRAPLRKNVVRLSIPSPGKMPETRMRMVEALPDGGDGTLRFQTSAGVAPASAPALRQQVGIPGYVPPEVLAVSRMEAERNGAGTGGRVHSAGFAPISLPLALGTEELMEFDPYSVQRTGNPFKDAPGEAGAFPAAAVGGGAWESGFFANNGLRPPEPESAPEPAVVTESAAGTSLRPPSAGGEPSGASLRPPAVADSVATVTISSIAPVAQAAVTRSFVAREAPQPPLPELSVRTMTSGLGRRESGQTVAAASPAGIMGGVALPLPPMALSDGGDVFASAPPVSAGAGGTPARMAVGPSVRPGEKIIDPVPAVSAPAVPARGSPFLPPLARETARLGAGMGVEEFIPMRGVRVF